jgi:hypothetical protein
MPVQIDQFDTEIEVTPSQASREAASGASTTSTSAASVSATSSDAFRRAVVAALEAEFDAYLRSRG